MCNYDCDLQDHQLILQMNQKINEGFDVNSCKRKSKRERLLLKKSLLNLDIFLIEKITDIKIPRDTGDFRMITKKITDNLKKFKNQMHF